MEIHKCAHCGNEDSDWLVDEGDTVYCQKCSHRTRKDNGEDDLVVCPACHHMRDRKAYYCRQCNSPFEAEYNKELDDLVEEDIKRRGEI